MIETVTSLTCDACGKKVPPDQNEGWWKLNARKQVPPTTVLDGEATAFVLPDPNAGTGDACSDKCFKQWATEEIKRTGAVTQA